MTPIQTVGERGLISITVCQQIVVVAPSSFNRYVSSVHIYPRSFGNGLHFAERRHLVAGVAAGHQLAVASSSAVTVLVGHHVPRQGRVVEMVSVGGCVVVAWKNI